MDGFMTLVRARRELSKLARVCQMRPSTVSVWQVVPVEHVERVAEGFETHPSQIRPDLARIFHTKVVEVLSPPSVVRRVCQEPGTRMRYYHRFADMKVGDELTFMGDSKLRESARLSAHNYRQRHTDWRFSSQTVMWEGQLGIRITRVVPR